jgi:dTDP-4-dehydrorhamnose 3,5-epimerase
MYYLTSAFYAPTAVRGVRYDSDGFNIQWPLPIAEISEVDAGWPIYRP